MRPKNKAVGLTIKIFPTEEKLMDNKIKPTNEKKIDIVNVKETLLFLRNRSYMTTIGIKRYCKTVAVAAFE